MRDCVPTCAQGKKRLSRLDVTARRIRSHPSDGKPRAVSEKVGQLAFDISADPLPLVGERPAIIRRLEAKLACVMSAAA